MDAAKSFEKAISLDDELTCSICLEIFLDPVSLPCLHSFCNECIRGIPTHRDYRSNNVAVTCPQCRTQVVLRNGTFDSLPKNFDLANIIAKFKQHRDLAHQKRIQRQSSSCSLHGKEFGLYCMTCYTALCTDCFSEHKHHDVENIAQAQGKCLADLNNLMLPHLTELCTALDEKCKKWKDAHREITTSVDNQCADVARKFSTLRDKLVMKETEIITEIQDKYKENITRHQKELIKTRAQLEKTQRLLTEAKNLKLTDVHTVLQCYGDFAKSVQQDLNQDIESARLVEPLPVIPHIDQLEILIRKIETELHSFRLESALQETVIDTEATEAEVIKAKLEEELPMDNTTEWKCPQSIAREPECSLENETEHGDEFYWPPPPPHHHPPPHHPPPHHRPHWFPPHHRPPHHGEHFPPPPPHHWGPRPPRHRRPCGRKWAWGGDGK
ncbi:hypothetical protein FSP39_012314 [Pinctada imbricata]|uniref:Uncharacterized protein n=1 Tax=Pinctada imbricata TaxID=66713 RepID=A0AA88XQP4_PINIB|nr:hypothetical protein FSP39_012314 [Pinctada imbricata]